MIKRILYLFMFAVALNSCEDATEIVQDGELNDAALFTSVANMQLFLNETYDQLTIQNDILVSSLLTDEVGLGSAGFPNAETPRFQVFSTNGFAAGIWNQYYRAINYSNRLLRGAALFTPPASELAAYNNIIAQARAARAFAHFQLLVYFSTDISDDDALGVMKVDFVPTTQQSIGRSTNGEVFELIEDDLLFAESNLTTNTTGANSWYFFNTNVINAMRARMYLYRKNYALAEQYADEVINNSGITLATSTFTLPTNFPLTSAETSQFSAAGRESFDANPPAGIQRALYTMDRWTATVNSPTYRKMWVDGNQGECIFSLNRVNNANNFGSAYNTNSSYTQGGPLYDMGRNLYDLFTQPLGGGAQDFRRWSFVDRSSSIAADPSTADKFTEVLVIDKYPGKNGSHSSNDLKVFRISEMYFIKAECRVRDNDFTAAATLIQQVRQARNYIAGATVPTPSYGSATAAFADIMLERRKELCFEGHRYIDLKRLGADAGITQTDRYIADSNNLNAVSPFNITVSDYRFTLPIPQAEINVNPMPQNPQY